MCFVGFALPPMMGEGKGELLGRPRREPRARSSRERGGLGEDRQRALRLLRQKQKILLVFAPPFYPAPNLSKQSSSEQ